MKTKFSNSIKLLILAGVLAAVTSYVAAFTPINPLPGTNPWQPVDTGAAAQVKSGGILSQKSFIAGTGITDPASIDGYIVAKALAGSAYGLFGNQILASGTTSQVKIGSATSTWSAPLIDSSSYTTPLTIDMSGRSGNADHEAIDVRSGALCKNNVTVNTNANAIRFATPNGDAYNPDNIDLIGRQVQLSDPSAGALKVLVATNDKGDAVWGTLAVVNGALKVNYGQSPVTTGQCDTPAVRGCTNPAATNYNSSATVDDGSCVMPTLCTSGIREGLPPLTNIQATGKIIEYVNTVNQNPGGSGAPLVPYYILLEELRHNGGPGNSCQIKAIDPACPPFDLDTVNDGTSFILDGIVYQTVGGNSWRVNSTVGDQCMMNTNAQVNGPDLIMYNIEF